MHADIHTCSPTQLNKNQPKEISWWQLDILDVNYKSENYWKKNKEEQPNFLRHLKWWFSSFWKPWLIYFRFEERFCQQKKKEHNCLKALIAVKHVAATSSKNWKKKIKHCFSSLIKWCETHRQCLIKTLVSQPELLGFQKQETGSGLLNNSVLLFCACQCVWRLVFGCAQVCCLFATMSVAGLPINTNRKRRMQCKKSKDSCSVPLQQGTLQQGRVWFILHYIHRMANSKYAFTG